MQTAFAGLRVIDLSDRMSGAWAARLFADFGADVLLCEDEQGHPLRRQAPFIDAGRRVSVLHEYINRGKYSYVPSRPTELIADADLIITTSATPGADLQDAIDALPAGAVHLSITPWGLTGPWSSRPGNHLTACAATGWAQINRCEGEAPLQLPGQQTGYIAGVAGFIGAAAALVRQQQSGQGEQVDVSESEALALTCAPWAMLGLFIGGGRLARGPNGPRARDRAGPLWRTRDGMINYGYGDWAQWTAAMESLGLDDLAHDPDYISVLGRNQKPGEPVRDALASASAPRAKWDIFHTLAGYRCIAGVVQDASELLRNEQLNARDFFVTTTTPGGQPVRAPGAPVRLSATPCQAEPAPAPRLNARGAPPAARKESETRPEVPPAAPLAGVRVLAFTQAWAGTFATELLALLGADVVQIESRQRADVWRGAGSPVPPAIRNPDIEQHGHNTNGMYNSVNLNKRAITLDMQDERGRAMFWEMLPRFDVLVDNFSPHVMPNWGVTLESLHAVQPRMIFASISGYGIGGPISEYAANGATTEPMAGLASIHGYAGDTAANTGGLIPDPISGYYMAAAIVAAIHHRERSGRGQRIDLAMLEAVAVQVGDAVAEYDATGHIRQPSGNISLEHAPHGYFATADEHWIALACESDDAWRALTRLMELPQSDTDRLATTSARLEHRDRVDDLVQHWLRGQEPEQTVARLCEIGVTAARVPDFVDIYANPSPQFSAREFLRPVTHPESGHHYMPVAPWRLRDSPLPSVRPSPCFGEHSREVLREELGVTDEAYDALVDAGITGTERIYPR